MSNLDTSDLIDEIFNTSPGKTIIRIFKTQVELKSARYRLYNVRQGLLSDGFLQDKKIKTKSEYKAVAGIWILRIKVSERREIHA